MTKLDIDELFKVFSKSQEDFLKENPTYIPMTNAPFYSDNVATFVPILHIGGSGSGKKEGGNDKTND